MKNFLWSLSLLWLVGCGPPPGPGAPPLLGPGMGPWIGWILALLLGVLFVLILAGVLTPGGRHSFRSDEAEELREIRDRLDSLEKAVARLERMLKDIGNERRSEL